METETAAAEAAEGCTFLGSEALKRPRRRGEVTIVRLTKLSISAMFYKVPRKSLSRFRTNFERDHKTRLKGSYPVYLWRDE